jgi:hypothetical protein
MPDEKTQKELLTSLIDMQRKQTNDITEIKTCLLGDEYTPDGLVKQVAYNKISIDNIKRTRLPEIEKSIASKSGIIGGVVAFLIVVITAIVTLASGIINK